MRPIKTVSLVFGVLTGLLGLLLLAVGAPLVWAHATQRDADGYYTTESRTLVSAGYAVVSDSIELHSDADDADLTRILGALGDARVTARSAGGQDLFVGVAPTADVERYLGASSYSMVDRMRETNGRMMPHYRILRGTAAPGLPTAQDFWTASAHGTGSQVLTWELESGDWTLVLMNTDATAGVDVVARAGFRTDLLLPLGIGLLVAGGVVLLVAVALLVFSATGNDVSGPRTPAGVVLAGAGPPPERRAYPVSVRAELDPGVSRWLWLVKWILVIPHAIVLAFLWIAFAVLTVVAGFAILFTGRYPRALFDLNVGILRWQWRVTFYALTLGTDRYPPFSLRPDPSYPADLDVPYPEHLSRGLVLIKWWLLALPHYLVIGVFGAMAWTTTWNLGWAQEGDARVVGGLGLTGLLALIAGVTLLFTRRYPQSIFDFILGMQRWTIRVAAYAALMRDEYPPFRLDLGGEEPPVPAPAPEPAPAPDTRAPV